MGPTTQLHRFHYSSFDVDQLVEAKGKRPVSLCIPAHNEEPTIGPIVACVQDALVRRVPLVDEVIVVDDCSTDATSEQAAKEGATVIHLEQPERGDQMGGRGKGTALSAATAVAKGEVLVFCDADLLNFEPYFVSALLGPILLEPSIQLVKATYRRASEGELGGGRVTELLAKPLLAELFPALAAVDQPLSGEWSVRRAVLDELTLEPGWGVDVAILIDVWRRFGMGAIAQVDLGTKTHRSRPLQSLVPQAREVAHAILERFRQSEDWSWT
jgi:glucosyl-3-phosphoglycerate synthase